MIIKTIVDFFLYSFLAITAQNAIFVRGLGVSEGLRMIKDPRKYTVYFCTALFFFQTMSIFLVYLILPIIDNSDFVSYRIFITPVLIVVSCAISYISTVFLLSAVVKKQVFANIIHSITSASINSAIVGTILLINIQSLNLSQALGFGLGSSIGYFLALIIINEMREKIKNEDIPLFFRGLPIELIYISIIALALYGIAGNSFAMVV